MLLSLTHFSSSSSLPNRFNFAGDWDRNLGQGAGVTDTSKYDVFPYYGPTRYDRDAEERVKFNQFMKERAAGLAKAAEQDAKDAKHKRVLCPLSVDVPCFLS